MPIAASRKRKLGDGDQKYYAVRAGNVPGVYLTWGECQANTTGFRGANYKSFLTRKDAEDFVAGKNPPGPSDARGGGKYYGLAVGRNPGVYTDWTECNEQAQGVKGPKFKKFPTRVEAQDWVDNYGKNDGPVVKKPKLATVSVTEDYTASSAASSSSKSKTIVYTDGSALGNGKKGASAGVGVYFGANDSRNVSEPLIGPSQTNQRAELQAIIRALEIAPTNLDLEIITDSQYSINCVTEWYKNWVKKDWIKSDGGKVVNRDLVERVRELVDERKGEGRRVEFVWVKGHAADPGNVAADRLAVMGAQRK